jgi:hypothetical protein
LTTKRSGPSNFRPLVTAGINFHHGFYCMKDVIPVLEQRLMTPRTSGIAIYYQNTNTSILSAGNNR